MKTGSAPPNTNTLLSDLSDLSSVSPAPEPGADTVGPAAAAAAAGKTQGTDGDSTKVNYFILYGLGYKWAGAATGGPM